MLIAVSGIRIRQVVVVIGTDVRVKQQQVNIVK